MLSTLLSLYIKFKKTILMKNILELDLNLFLVGRGLQPPPIHGDRVGALDPDQDVTEHQPLDFRGENRSGVANFFFIIMILTQQDPRGRVSRRSGSRSGCH